MSVYYFCRPGLTVFQGMYEISVCPDGDWFKLTWDIGSSRDTLNKTHYTSWGIHSATKQILASQE